MNKQFVASFMGALLMVVLFDFWMSKMTGYTWFADINWSMGTNLLSFQQLLFWIIEAAVVVMVSYTRRPINNPLARVIRLGLVLGLTCVMICHVNLAVHLDTIPVLFMAESLLLFSWLNTMKFIAMVGVVYLLAHRPQMTKRVVDNN
ncbi:MAG: hypothetical protein OQK49_06610 [Proteobacteria bacterium]|nr:hypothetical protein [Pseudomonadota bacterium]